MVKPGENFARNSQFLLIFLDQWIIFNQENCQLDSKKGQLNITTAQFYLNEPQICDFDPEDT